MSNLQIFCSTMAYALGKELGIEAAGDEWARQVRDPGPDSLPAARMFGRVKALTKDTADMAIMGDVAATSIAKSRSRSFHAAIQQKADFWFACDDDVEATHETVANMLSEADTPKPRIVFLPCYLRGRPVVGVKFSTGAKMRGLSKPIEWAATCCYVANRGALQRLNECCQHLKYRDDDQVERLAVFHETLNDGRWYGEDHSFCLRASLCGVELVAVVVGTSSHDGAVLTLSQLQGDE